jgi:hypothetical protein
MEKSAAEYEALALETLATSRAQSISSNYHEVIRLHAEATTYATLALAAATEGASATSPI